MENDIYKTANEAFIKYVFSISVHFSALA